MSNFWKDQRTALEKNIRRIDGLKAQMSFDNWVESQIRINRFKTEAQLKILKECQAQRNAEFEELGEWIKGCIDSGWEITKNNLDEFLESFAKRIKGDAA